MERERGPGYARRTPPIGVGGPDRSLGVDHEPHAPGERGLGVTMLGFIRAFGKGRAQLAIEVDSALQIGTTIPNALSLADAISPNLTQRTPWSQSIRWARATMIPSGPRT